MLPLLPHCVDVEQFRVAGIKVRTSNKDEQDSRVAKLPALWTDFYAKKIEKRPISIKKNPLIYGIYTHYESGINGYYDVIAGMSLEDAKTHFSDVIRTTFSEVSIQAGKYLVFSAQGKMPDTVIQAWITVWKYFVENPEIHRTFQSDFEAYETAELVSIYIGIIS